MLSRFIIMLIQSLFIFCTKISFSIIIINSSLSLKEWQEDCHFLKQFRQHFQSYTFYTFQSSWSAILDPKGDIQSNNWWQPTSSYIREIYNLCSMLSTSLIQGIFLLSIDLIDYYRILSVNCYSVIERDFWRREFFHQKIKQERFN